MAHRSESSIIQAAAATAASEVFEQIVRAQVTLLSFSHYDHVQLKIKREKVVGCQLRALKFCFIILLEYANTDDFI